MGCWFQSVTDLATGEAVLRQRHYGMIEAVDGRFRRVVLRPWPKLVFAAPPLFWGSMEGRTSPGDHCRLYYNQPFRTPNYLALMYVVAGRDGTLASLRRVLEVLDEIAWLKRSDAIVCDAMNTRLSERILARGGWESHCPSRWHRHFIKRFYGKYPVRSGFVVEATAASV